jgi:putative acetyltransferase
MADHSGGKGSSSGLGWTLRALEPGDYADWHAIRLCPQVMRNTLALPYMSVESARARLAQLPEGSHVIVAEMDGRVVGQAWLERRWGRCSHVGQPGIMVHDDYTGRGIGAALLGAIIDLAENWLGLWRLELEVYTDNAPALALYRKFGFEIEGTKQRYALRDGAYVDAHVMARLTPGLFAASAPLAPAE